MDIGKINLYITDAFTKKALKILCDVPSLFATGMLISFDGHIHSIEKMAVDMVEDNGKVIYNCFLDVNRITPKQIDLSEAYTEFLKSYNEQL